MEDRTARLRGMLFVRVTGYPGLIAGIVVLLASMHIGLRLDTMLILITVVVSGIGGFIAGAGALLLAIANRSFRPLLEGIPLACINFFICLKTFALLHWPIA